MCLRQVFLVQCETFDAINARYVIIVQSVVVLNMNTEVFRINDMNTLYNISDLEYNGKYFMYVWGKFSFWPKLPQLTWPTLPLTDFFQISRDSSF